jgi:hypothetical protein
MANGTRHIRIVPPLSALEGDNQRTVTNEYGNSVTVTEISVMENQNTFQGWLNETIDSLPGSISEYEIEFIIPGPRPTFVFKETS